MANDIFKALAQRILQSNTANMVAEKIEALAAILKQDSTIVAENLDDPLVNHRIAKAHATEIKAILDDGPPKVGEAPAEVQDEIDAAAEDDEKDVDLETTDPETTDPETADSSDTEVDDEEEEEAEEEAVEPKEPKDDDVEETEEEVADDQTDQEEAADNKEEDEEKVDDDKKKSHRASESSKAMDLIVDSMGQGQSFEDAYATVVGSRSAVTGRSTRIANQIQEEKLMNDLKLGQRVRYTAIPRKTASGGTLPTVPVIGNVVAKEAGKIKFKTAGVDPFWIPLTVNHGGKKMQLVVAVEEDPKKVTASQNKSSASKKKANYDLSNAYEMSMFVGSLRRMREAGQDDNAIVDWALMMGYYDMDIQPAMNLVDDMSYVSDDPSKYTGSRKHKASDGRRDVVDENENINDSTDMQDRQSALSPAMRAEREARLKRLSKVVANNTRTLPTASKLPIASANATPRREAMLSNLRSTVAKKERENEVLANRNRKLEAEKLAGVMVQKRMITAAKVDSEVRTMVAMDTPTWNATRHLVDTFTAATPPVAVNPNSSRRTAAAEQEIKSGFGPTPREPSTPMGSGMSLDDPHFYDN